MIELFKTVGKLAVLALVNIKTDQILTVNGLIRLELIKNKSVVE